MSHNWKTTDRQVDDNIDDLGRKPDGSKQEQPETKKIERIKEETVDAERDHDEEGDANPSPMHPAFP